MLAFLRFLTLTLMILPIFSKNLRSTEIDTFNHIDDLFLEDTFDEMEKMLHEDEYRIAIIEESKGMLSDMLLEEVNCLEKKLTHGDIDCPKTEI